MADGCAGDGFVAAAVVGDNLAMMTKNKGIAAIVIDGIGGRSGGHGGRRAAASPPTRREERARSAGASRSSAGGVGGEWRRDRNGVAVIPQARLGTAS